MSNKADGAERNKQLIERSEARTFVRKDGYTIGYRLFKPKNIEPGRKYPLIVYLHGAGSRGTDNISQVATTCALSLIAGNVAEKHPCFFFAPQTSTKVRWVETDWSRPTPHKTPDVPS
ncbi:MAG: hypothetical protein PHQ75_09835, partial [Thermoguttaceae bacterium]|nr:hypothetical protein [Thermoguttaceae bacterium]